MIPDDFWKHQHVETANSVFNWLVMARRLIHSAHLLDSQSVEFDVYKDVRNVARMCMGMALECYLKALYLANGNILHNGKEQKTFGSHDLVGMAKDVGFIVTPDQEKVLYYLSMYLLIKGRYPVPLKLHKMKLHPTDITPFETHGIKWDEASYEICNDMVRSLEQCIANTRAK